MAVRGPAGVRTEGGCVEERSSGVELELKFELSPADVRRLCRTPWLTSLQEGKSRRQSLRAVYFDTPDFALLERRISLRVRKESHAYVQCLKSKTSSDHNGFSRHEKEWRIKRARLDLGILKNDAEAADILSGIDLSTLREIFETDVARRTRILVCEDGTRLKCEIDKGVIRAGDGETSVYEMELEFVSGRVASFYDVARRIVRTVPARLSLQSKAQRGFSLAGGGKAHRVRTRRAAPRRETTNGALLQGALETGLQQILLNVPYIHVRSDGEGIHRMRVALRRMRSLLSLYKKEQWGAQVHEMGRLAAMIRKASNTLGDARDWDVFIGTTLSSVRFSDAAGPGGEALLDEARVARGEAYARAQSYLKSTDFARLLVELAAFSTLGWNTSGGGDDASSSFTRGVRPPGDLEAPVAPFARRELARRHARVMKRAKNLKKLSPPDRHRLRIAVKKLRYACEVFSPLLCADGEHPYLTALGRLQNVLGRLNDRTVAEQLLKKIGGARGKNDKHSAKGKNLWRAIGEVSGWYGHKQIGQDRKLLSVWDDFCRRRPFWEDG